jgi:hypothetical protein
MSRGTQPTQTPIHQSVKTDEDETLVREPAYKQAIVPGGIPILPRRLLKLLHLA